MFRRLAPLAALVVVLSGCTSHKAPSGDRSHDAGVGTVPGTGDLPGSPSGSGDAPGASFAGTTKQPPTGGAPQPARTSGGWTVTVYYTAVERFHSGPRTRVTGCPKMACSRGGDDLGSYPDDFVKAVKDEGTGRLADGRYLNWSSDTGYWLDTAPRDSAGRALQPWVSAAADRDVLAQGSRFTVVDCGRDEGGGAVNATVCGRLRGAHWTITDEFTPGLGGTKHIDLYLGEETGPGFTNTAWYTTLVGASVSVTVGP